jgi:hypothetical protein
MSTDRGHTHCWETDPTGTSHCTLDRGHTGDHLNWFMPKSDPRREWPAEKQQSAR